MELGVDLAEEGTKEIKDRKPPSPHSLSFNANNLLGTLSTMESSPYLSLHTFLTSAAISASPLCTLTPIPRMGTGLVAVADTPPHTELFSVPKTAVLTTKTCGLKELLPKEEWEGLNGGWGRLILCLMYEQGRGEASPWKGYLGEL